MSCNLWCLLGSIEAQPLDSKLLTRFFLQWFAYQMSMIKLCGTILPKMFFFSLLTYHTWDSSEFRCVFPAEPKKNSKQTVLYSVGKLFLSPLLLLHLRTYHPPWPAVPSIFVSVFYIETAVHMTVAVMFVQLTWTLTIAQLDLTFC